MRSLLFAVLALGLTSTAQAQLSKTEGFQLGGSLYANSMTIRFDDGDFSDDSDLTGGGVGLRVGYGFNRLFTLFLDLGGGPIESAECDNDCDGDTFGYGELGGEFSFGGPAQKWVPFVNVALGGTSISNTEGIDTAISGGGVTLGGGVNYFATPQLAIRAQLSLSGGAITTFEVGGNDVDVDDVTYGVGRLHIGATYRF